MPPTDQSVIVPSEITSEYLESVPVAAPAPVAATAARPGRTYRQLIRHITAAYDSTLIRAYCRARFTIININILHMLALCLRGQHRVLDIGCGFGLFGCYLASIYPDMEYRGFDLNPRRIDMANKAASRLGLRNASFSCTDARDLHLDDRYDAVMMIDLLHHIDDASKHALLATCARHLNPGGRLVIKDVNTRPFHKVAFTWALDVLMTKGFDMWYWSDARFHAALDEHFTRTDAFPIADWLPYPHVIYLADHVRSQ